jgi:hypothetical protein
MNINGREFEFVRITLDKQKEIERKIGNNIWVKFGGLGAQIAWRRFCRIAFVMDWAWKYLHIHPKQLSTSDMLLGMPAEVQAAFFEYYQGELKRAKEQLKVLGLLDQNNIT